MDNANEELNKFRDLVIGVTAALDLEKTEAVHGMQDLYLEALNRISTLEKQLEDNKTLTKYSVRGTFEQALQKANKQVSKALTNGIVDSNSEVTVAIDVNIKHDLQNKMFIVGSHHFPYRTERKPQQNDLYRVWDEDADKCCFVALDYIHEGFMYSHLNIDSDFNIKWINFEPTGLRWDPDLKQIIEIEE
jgi:hypothetical protein